MDWQPIETAPRDGKWIFVASCAYGAPDVFEAHWRASGVFGNDDGAAFPDAYAWHPLLRPPPPPEPVSRETEPEHTGWAG